MKSLSKTAGACLLMALLAACGGGGGGSDAADAARAADDAVTVGQATPPTTQPATDPSAPQTPDDAATPPVAGQDAAPTQDVAAGAEPVSGVASEFVASVATDAWVQTWNDAELDAYYPLRPIRVLVTGQGTVGNSVRGNAGTMSCVQGGTNCNAIYTKYKTVLLSAVPKAGQVFRGWGGACIGSGKRDTCEIRNYMLHNVTASFGPA
ncbi:MULTISPECIES: hypothetical protein [unclassified Rhizobacter]|uniref:hypothetical protein n=1 Tax=unclassified Rhizobacter TaxID=2640088 RepID=UPI00070D75D8|nr:MULTISPECIES: hypothetical protein [unclassified Rhizobacter]KQU81559.1 hypothetical protein ASC88_01395 [Rhizobacter sp. Root29]